MLETSALRHFSANLQRTWTEEIKLMAAGWGGKEGRGHKGWGGREMKTWKGENERNRRRMTCCGREENNRDEMNLHSF